MALARKKDDGWSRSLTLPGPESVGDLLSGLGRPALPALAADREERRAFAFRCLVAALLRAGELPLPVTLGLPGRGDDPQLFALIAPGGRERLVRVLLPEEDRAAPGIEDEQLLSAAEGSVLPEAPLPGAVHLLRGSTVTLRAEGNKRLEVDLSEAYEVDYLAWTQAQARLLRSPDREAADHLNLAEEIESLGRSDRFALESQIARLLLHLLKWEFQPKRRSRSWILSIRDARREVARRLRSSPSLAREARLSEIVAQEYRSARSDAAIETRLPTAIFPETCPYTLEQLLDDDFPPAAG